MSYKSKTIADLLGKLNRSYFLPAIQRPFVWEPEQIVRLFDSLMQGYLPRNFMSFIRAREMMISERLKMLFDFAEVDLVEKSMEELAIV